MGGMSVPAKDDRFSLVVLCTANRFRSPICAGHVRLLTAGLPVDVRSAAVSGPSGPRALARALELAAAGGIDLRGHRARALEPGALTEADLVLGFEQAHVAAAVVEGGARRERAFTLPEFVPLAEAVAVADHSNPVERARKVVAVAAERRAASPRSLSAELADPVGGPARGYDEAARALERLSARLVRALFGVSG
jgi:protein-tyrosine phosphatase